MVRINRILHVVVFSLCVKQRHCCYTLPVRTPQLDTSVCALSTFGDRRSVASVYHYIRTVAKNGLNGNWPTFPNKDESNKRVVEECAKQQGNDQ